MGVTTSTANAGATYTPIATTTLSSSATTITFTSIPSTYTDLKIVLSGTGGSGADIRTYFNNDGGTNYSRTYIYGDGSSAVSGRESNMSWVSVGSTEASQSNAILQIQNYSNTTTYKSLISRQSGASRLVYALVGLWRSTSAINRIDFVNSNASTVFDAGYTVTIYGIKAA